MALALLCLIAPDFELQVLRRGQPGFCVLVTRADASARVLAVDAALADVGVQPGQSLAQARARLCLVESRLERGAGERGPVALTVLLPDPQLVARSMEELLEELHAVAPGLHVEGPGLVFVDPRDLQWLEPDVERLAARLVEIVRRHRLSAKVGIGPGRLVARLTALGAGEGAVPRTEDGAAFLAPMGLGALPLDARMRESMGHLGLRTLGDLARLSERHVSDRWGGRALGAWRLARGEDAGAGMRWRPGLRHEAVVELDGAGTSEALGFALAAPLEHLLEAVRRSGGRPESLTIDLAAEGGGRARRVVLHVDPRAALPTCGSLLALLRLELERAEPESELAKTQGYVRARLALGRAPAAIGAVADLAQSFGESRTEGNLFVRRRETGEPLAVSLARLRTRLGADAVGTAELRSAVRPEGGWRWRALGEAGADGEGGWGTKREARGTDLLDLLPLPEGTALRLVSGGPREIAAPDVALRAVGPCTLSGEWWDAEFARDYYLVAADPQRGEPRARLVFRDRCDDRWYVQGEVD